MIEAALVLEGGALRSVYTAGVLDIFLEKKLAFSYVAGVSAGALCAANYISKQAGRSARVNIDLVRNPRYLGLRHLIREGSYFNFDFLFGEPAKAWSPFDRDTFFASPQAFLIGATDCRTGRPVYFRAKDYGELVAALTASSSLPLLTPTAFVDGAPCADGGIGEAVPLQRALADGNQKLVLILTRQRGYRKKPVSGAFVTACRAKYRDYPALVERLADQPERYNRLMDRIDDMERAGELFVIRPKAPVTVRRTEKNQKKLRALYFEGRREAAAALGAMERYLGVASPV